MFLGLIVQDILFYFRALADSKRLRIVQYLARHEQITVTDLGLQMRLSQPLISWHLRFLRRAGIVTTRRAGRQVWCSLDRKALLDYERRVDQVLGIEAANSETIDERLPLTLNPLENP
jgi:ArsR family transcriptional regulator, arsenate/arsenite/antimonite-responsive transcriptional repressor